MLSLEEAAEHVKIDKNELKHCAQRGEIPAQMRGDDWYFSHRDLDEWAQRYILAMKPAALKKREGTAKSEWRLASFFLPSAIKIDSRAKGKAGMIRDAAETAIASTLVYDTEGFYKELAAREEAAPTVVGNGAAFLHPRYHDPYFFEGSFIAYVRNLRGVYFGAPEGATTHHFFVICSTDHEEHLKLLARLAVLAHGTAMLDLLGQAETNEEVPAIIAKCEEEMFS